MKYQIGETREALSTDQLETMYIGSLLNAFLGQSVNQHRDSGISESVMARS